MKEIKNKYSRKIEAQKKNRPKRTVPRNIFICRKGNKRFFQHILTVLQETAPEG